MRPSLRLPPSAGRVQIEGFEHQGCTSGLGHGSQSRFEANSIPGRKPIAPCTRTVPNTVQVKYYAPSHTVSRSSGVQADCSACRLLAPTGLVCHPPQACGVCPSQGPGPGITLLIRSCGASGRFVGPHCLLWQNSAYEGFRNAQTLQMIRCSAAMSLVHWSRIKIPLAARVQSYRVAAG
jgi:hypothetical protein